MARIIYITNDDMIRRYGEQEFEDLKSHIDGTDAERQETLDKAYNDATDEMNSYLSVRYSVAIFDPPPAMIKIYCCDIARLRLWTDDPIEEVRKRYERALKWLGDARDGKANITDDEGNIIDETDGYQNPVLAGSRDEIYTEGLFDQMPDRGGRRFDCF